MSLLSLNPASRRVWARVPEAAAAMVSASSACVDDDVEASDVRSDLFPACSSKHQVGEPLADNISPSTPA